jgi:hypothetical protein
LPLGLIYASAAGAIRSSWVADIEAGNHKVFVTLTPSGWSNDNVGLAWLEQVFKRCTKQQSGRRRLLVLDDHRSHLTIEFISYCDSHRILLIILLPHLTHTLQPLDVALFYPLAQAYLAKLTYHLYRAYRLVPLNKGDFFPLF